MVTPRTLWTVILLCGALAPAPAVAQAQSNAHGGQNDGRPWAIVGSWFGTTTTGLKQLITFHDDGTVLRSVPGEVSIDPARPPHTAAHGVWRYLGNGRFGVTIWDIFYDVNTGQLRHFMKLRLEPTMAEDGDHANAIAVLGVIDPQ